MAFDAFVSIGGIEGESSDSGHSGWIKITSCDMEIKQTISTTDSSAGAAGTHFDSITIELCRAGTEKIKFMEIKLTNSFISSIALSAGGDFPCETVSLAYGKIEWKYTQQSRTGGYSSGNVAGGWDLQRNCKV